MRRQDERVLLIRAPFLVPAKRFTENLWPQVQQALGLASGYDRKTGSGYGQRPVTTAL